MNDQSCAKAVVSAAILAALMTLLVPARAQAADKQPNIVFIMGDDIGMWNIGAYHRGLMAGRTPNLDKLAKEGMLFTAGPTSGAGRFTGSPATAARAETPRGLSSRSPTNADDPEDRTRRPEST